MGILDILILVIIVCAAIFVLCYVAHHKENSGGCNGDCAGCTGHFSGAEGDCQKKQTK